MTAKGPRSIVLALVLLIPIMSAMATESNAVDDIEDDDTDKIEYNEELYNGNDVDELLDLCKDVDYAEQFDSQNEQVIGYQCIPAGCMPDCNKHRLLRLHDVQNRTESLLDSLNDFRYVFLDFLMFVIPLLQGLYLIFKRHFNWKTLPVIGYRFEDDPTDGYRYSHYMWMQWVTLDSDHPMYYKGMTPDTKEVEYLPQIKQWRDPEADSEEDLQPHWSMRDIYDMTADPHERLEFYFRRIRQPHQANKQGRKTIKKFKQTKMNKN